MNNVLMNYLSKNESLVYTDILKNGPSKATTVAKRINIARNKVYDALYRLESKSLIFCEPGKVKIYALLDPSKIKIIADEMLQKQEQLNSELKEAFPEIRALYEASKTPVPVFTYQRGLKAIVSDIRQEVHETSSFIYIFARRMTFFEDYHLITAYRQLIKRGVDVRVITIDDAQARKITKKMGAKGLFLPQSQQFKRTMIVKDNIFAISIYGKGNDLRIKTDSPEIIDAFKSFFLIFWDMRTHKH